MNGRTTSHQRKAGFDEIRAKFDASFQPIVEPPADTAVPESEEETQRKLSPQPFTQMATKMSLEQETRILAKEIVDQILRDQNRRTPAHVDETSDIAKLIFDTGISARVFKNEVRSTLSRLQGDHGSIDVESQRYSSAHQATIRSLKRQVAETTKELEEVKRKYQLSLHDKLRLADAVERLERATEVCMKVHVPREAQLREMKVENELLVTNNAELEDAAKRFDAEKARFTSTIARYREELMLANHQRETAELESAQAKSRVEELEKRAKESKESAMGVNVRIKELQEVQDAMTALFNDTNDAESSANTRRSAVDLGERRSHLVGRIVNLLTRNKNTRNETASSAEGNAQASTDSAAKSEIASSAQRIPMHDVGTSHNTGHSFEPGRNDSPSSISKPLLEGIRKFGNELTRVGTNRLGKKSLLANVEKSRAAIENDATLREVIALKEREVERLAQELNNANEKTASLERSLQQERQKRRLENPTITDVLEQPEEEEASTVLVSRKKTLFEWHSNSSSTAQSPVRISDSFGN